MHRLLDTAAHLEDVWFASKELLAVRHMLSIGVNETMIQLCVLIVRANNSL